MTLPFPASSCLRHRNFLKRQNFVNMCSNFFAPGIFRFLVLTGRSGDGVEQTALHGLFWKTLQLSQWLYADAAIHMDYASADGLGRRGFGLRNRATRHHKLIPVSSGLLVRHSGAGPCRRDLLWACCACHASSTANACSPRLSICFMAHAHHPRGITLSSDLNKE